MYVIVFLGQLVIATPLIILSIIEVNLNIYLKLIVFMGLAIITAFTEFKFRSFFISWFKSKLKDEKL